MHNQNVPSSYDTSVAIVRNAIPRMSELKIPITPNNYAVWYEYLTEANKELQKEMDTLLKRDVPITNHEMQALYERYLEERSENFKAAKTVLSQIVNSLINNLTDADDHYSSFTTELSDIAKRLDEDTSTEDLTGLMDQALYLSKNNGRNQVTWENQKVNN